MRPVLIHCSYHKCLTVYFSGVVGRILGQNCEQAGYAHFNSDLEAFYANQSQFELASVNNHSVDLSRYTDYRVTRLMRDPRDLVVSGYFYHRRAAESWCDEPARNDRDWLFVNGHVPEAIRDGTMTFSEWLKTIDAEAGLLGELEFRKHHFESMRNWSLDDPKVLLRRYEDILGREARVMNELLQFLEWSPGRRMRGALHAWKRSVKTQNGGNFHVRDPSPGQWRKHFTPLVCEAFNDLYGDILDQYGYARK